MAASAQQEQKRMAKNKQKNKSELEYLRGQIKKLESINRKLKQKVASLEKHAHFYDKVIDDVASQEEADIDVHICIHCGKGIIERVDLKYLIIESCGVCGYKNKIKVGS